MKYGCCWITIKPNVPTSFVIYSMPRFLSAWPMKFVCSLETYSVIRIKFCVHHVGVSTLISFFLFLLDFTKLCGKSGSSDPDSMFDYHCFWRSNYATNLHPICSLMRQRIFFNDYVLFFTVQIPSFLILQAQAQVPDSQIDVYLGASNTQQVCL